MGRESVVLADPDVMLPAHVAHLLQLPCVSIAKAWATASQNLFLLRKQVAGLMRRHWPHLKVESMKFLEVFDFVCSVNFVHSDSISFTVFVPAVRQCNNQGPI